MTHEQAQPQSFEQNMASEVSNLAFQPGRYEVDQAHLEAMVPGFFTQPEGVVGVTPKTEAEVQAITPETAMEDLNKLPLIQPHGTFGDSMTFIDPDGYQIPVDRIIAASGHGADYQPTWAGRNGGWEYTGGKRSIEKIVDFAKRGKYEHNDATLEEKIALYTLFAPNGEAFFLAESGNHRVSAAKLRGDKTVTAKYIHVFQPEKATLSQHQVDEIYGRPSVFDTAFSSAPQTVKELSPVEKFMQEAEDIEAGQEMRVGGRMLKFKDNLMSREHRVPVLVFEQGEGMPDVTITVEDYLREQAEFATENQEAIGDIGDIAVEAEQEPRARADLLFAPVFASTEAQEDFDFSYLVGDDSKAPKGVEDAAVRVDKNVRSRVTPESEREAADSLREAKRQDEQLEGIIEAYEKGQGKQLIGADAVRAIRTDPGLRKEIGMYLTQKLEGLVRTSIVPPRVNRNDGKSTKADGYSELGNLTSREYATLLALSMIDGTFNATLAASTPEDYDIRTDTGDGQHRFAARQLLFTRR